MAIEWDGKKPQEILDEELEKARVAIIHNIRESGQWASGRTGTSMRVETTDDTGTLYGRKAFGTLETGRKGGRVPRLFNAIIYQWMMDKGIHGRPLPYKIQGNHKYSPQERGDRAMAGAIAYTIRKKGTRLYREGGRDDVYTPVVRATIRRITDRFAGLVEAMIENIRLNDIGDNRV